MMEDYKRELFKEQLAGIRLGAWQRFLKVFADESAAEQTAHYRIEELGREVASKRPPRSAGEIEEFKKKLRDIMGML
jgi:hypothetical protein